LGAAGGAIARRVLNGGRANPFAGVLGGKGGRPAQHVPNNADDVFRGTTKGYEGSAGTQAAGATPTSSDPLVAATFCKNAVCTHGGTGEFQAIDPRIADDVIVGGYKPAEFEVILEGVTPNQVTNSPLTQSYTLPQAEDAFSQMGITVPNSRGLNGLEDTLNILQSQGITPLSPAQIQQFQNNLNGVQ